MIRKSLALVLVVLLAQGCASLGGAKQVGFQGFAVAHTSFMLTKSVEADLVCGKSAAPPAPLCVPDAVHGQILEILSKGLGIDGDLGRAVQAVPEKNPLPAEVGTMIGQLTKLISDVLALIPKSPQKAALQDKVKIQ